MTDPLLDYHNDLPVELSAPDITEYRESNSGVEYIHTMDSGKPGPHVLISAVVHGNELCGAIAADWLLQQAAKPVAGRLSVGFMNVEAYLSYDADHPNRSRWVDEDFNRLWGPGVLADPKRTITSEVRRVHVGAKRLDSRLKPQIAILFIVICLFDPVGDTTIRTHPKTRVPRNKMGAC